MFVGVLSKKQEYLISAIIIKIYYNMKRVYDYFNGRAFSVIRQLKAKGPWYLCVSPRDVGVTEFENHCRSYTQRVEAEGSDFVVDHQKPGLKSVAQYFTKAELLLHAYARNGLTVQFQYVTNPLQIQSNLVRNNCNSNMPLCKHTWLFKGNGRWQCDWLIGC